MWSFCFTQHYLLLGNCFWFPATFLTYRFLYQQYINSVTTSCLGTPGIATCMWFTLLAVNIFRGNKKTRSRVTFGAEVDSANKWICSKKRSSRGALRKSAVKYLEKHYYFYIIPVKCYFKLKMIKCFFP